MVTPTEQTESWTFPTLVFCGVPHGAVSDPIISLLIWVHAVVLVSFIRFSWESTSHAANRVLNWLTTN